MRAGRRGARVCRTRQCTAVNSVPAPCATSTTLQGIPHLPPDQVIVAQADGNLTKLTLASNGGLTSSNVARNFTVPTSGGMFVDRSAG